MPRRSAFARSCVAPLLALSVAALSPGVLAPAAASEFNATLDVGDAAPAFKALPAADGKNLSLADLKDRKAVVVVFTCNHCPIAKAYEGRMQAFAKEYADKGVTLVAISVSKEPEDTLEKMAELARERGLAYPYLKDPTQAVGKAYGATATPQVFVLGPERKVRYMGSWDDSWRESKPAENHYVRDAVDALLAGNDPPVAEKRPFGCGIVYE